MPISGTLINCALIIVGTLLGIAAKKVLPEHVKDTMMHAVGLIVMFIGIGGAVSASLTYADGIFGTKDTLVMILSMALGAALGELIDIEKHLDALGVRCQKKFAAGESATFAAGMVTATLLFCVGAMAILGSFNAGLKQDYELLFTKSLLDGISSCMLSVSLGLGVLFSSVPVFVYQGLLALLAHVIAPLLSNAAIAEITCCGSVMILAIGLNMLHLTKIKTADLLPAVLFAPVLTWAFSFLPL